MSQSFQRSGTAPQNLSPSAAGSRTHWLALLLLAGVWMVLVAAIQPLGDFPLNDDWVYGLAVRSILETGRYALPSPASANVTLQAYWGALFCLPFGFSFTALRVSTLVLGGIGVAAVYLLLREATRKGDTPGWAPLVGALTLAVNPLYLGLSASFMTDVPFMTLVTLSLWLYLRGIRRGGALSVCAAIALAFAAASIRQFGLVLLVAFALTHLARNGFGWRHLAVAILPVVAGVVLQIAYTRWMMASGRTPIIHAPLATMVPRMDLPRRTAALVLMTPLYLGLAVAPLLLMRLPAGTDWRQTLRAWRWQAVLAGFLLLALVGSSKRMPGFGNILASYGLGPLTLRDTYILALNLPAGSALADAAWLLITAISAVAGAAVVFAIVRQIGGCLGALRSMARRETMGTQTLMLAYLLSTLGALFLISYGASVFDRYFLPLVPAVMVLLLARALPARRGAALAGVALLAVFAVFSVCTTHDYLAWNRARWQATDTLLRAGVTPAQIDGGYEFNGWHLYQPNFRMKPGKSYWWVLDDEYMITSGPVPGYQETARVAFHPWLGQDDASIWVLRRRPPS